MGKAFTEISEGLTEAIDHAKGKSGGVRVIYYFHSEMMPLYLLAAFGKNEKANISAEEKVILSKAIIESVAYWRKNNGQGIH